MNYINNNQKFQHQRAIKRSILYFILIVFGVSFSSCSKNLVPFTSDIQKKYNLDEERIEKIQFYTSKDIRLFREVTTGHSAITNGTIRIEEGKEIEEIIIPEGTPGVAVWIPKEQKFGVSFESSDDTYLTFGPNPKTNDRYYLLASEWKNRIGTVTYNGEKFNTSQQSADSFLLVDLKKVRKTDVDQRVAKGRTIN